jgi:hypothetical protein
MTETAPGPSLIVVTDAGRVPAAKAAELRTLARSIGLAPLVIGVAPAALAEIVQYVSRIADPGKPPPRDKVCFICERPEEGGEHEEWCPVVTGTLSSLDRRPRAEGSS